MHKVKLSIVLYTLALTLGDTYAWAYRRPLPGAERLSVYLPELSKKRVGLVVNRTARIGSMHLIDVLRSHNVSIQKIFTPEHGFWGDKEAGVPLNDATDTATGLVRVSLYGKRKAPSMAMLADIDVLVFDMQDVGVRCYTYLTTLHYVMQACAQSHTPLLVLDRPNPNLDVVDGPVLQPQLRSFVGQHPIPLVHGMTLGELALMINGQGWLENQALCPLMVVPVQYYTRETKFVSPVAPSPNLSTAHAVRLYPSLCLFEGTCMSVGRGTPAPFERIGYPDAHFGDFCFTPSKVHLGIAPKHAGQKCFGVDLRTVKPAPRLQIEWLVTCHAIAREQGIPFFKESFDAHSGERTLRLQMEAGWSAERIRASWQPALEAFREKRKPYLLYP